MAKKIYDILPSKVAHKIENTIKELDSKNKKPKVKNKAIKERMTSVKEYGGQNKKSKRIPLKEILIGGTIIVFLLISYGITKLPKADIQIWPKIDILTLSEKITADKSVNAVNFSSKIIPARYIEVQKDNWQSFPATGSASNDGKATGVIKIYNKTNSVFTLIKGTHFLSDSGKYFVTLEKISIPAAKKSSPGSVNANVQAEESGTDYNIGPSKFSVPKLNGTIYYYSIYGESNDAMSGGYTGNVKKVTDNDIKQAKDSLTKKTLQDAKDSLKSQITSSDVLLDGAIESIVIDASSDVKSGAIIDKFNESVKVKVSALIFKKQDIEKFIRDDVLSKLPKTDSFLKENLDISYDSEFVDMKGGKLTFHLKSLVKTYYDVNTNNLIDLFVTKDSDQIKKVIDQIYNDRVSKLKINFWPFWVHKATDNKNRINVNLLFDNY